MDFHLSFPISTATEKINYSDKLFFIGSCFAENIGELMQNCKFESIINPNGILYNPVSISNSLNAIIENKQIGEDELFFANECWNSWDFHSKYSHLNKQECLNAINKSISTAHHFLKQSNWLFVTLGSSFVYEQNETGRIVANCHKTPQKEFTKRLLEVDEIQNAIVSFFETSALFNSELKIVFTISPVRYIRDGVVENNLSKARLIEAVHQLIKKRTKTFYFPAYELVIDDLRDYRFYNSDMVHPNEQAIEYVFEKLKKTYFNEESKQLFNTINTIIKASLHRPFHEESLSHKKFKANYLQQCKQLIKDYPFLNLTKEIAIFNVY